MLVVVRKPGRASKTVNLLNSGERCVGRFGKIDSKGSKVTFVKNRVYIGNIKALIRVSPRCNNGKICSKCKARNRNMMKRNRKQHKKISSVFS